MLFQMGQVLRGLAPFNDAVALARRMARQYAQQRAAGGAAAAGYVVPDDADFALVVAAIEKKLGNRGSRARRATAPLSLQIDPDGRAVVPAELVERLGDGDAGRGRRLLDRIVSAIRQGRVLARLRQHDAGR